MYKRQFAYCSRIFSTWEYECITNPEEYAEYAYIDDCINGRIGFRRYGDEYERAQQMREERRKKHEAERGGSNGDDTAQDL